MFATEWMHLQVRKRKKKIQHERKQLYISSEENWILQTEDHRTYLSREKRNLQMLESAIIYDSASAFSSPEFACRDSDSDNRLGTPELLLPVPSDGSVKAGGSEEDPKR